MPSAPSSLKIDTTALQETVGQMCAGHERLEGFLRSLFGDLDALADELARKSKLADSIRQDQNNQWSGREERFQRERQELEATLERIQQLTEQLGDSAVASSGDSAQLHELFANMAEERTSFQAALRESESERAEQLGRQRQNLEATVERIQELTERLNASAAGSGRSEQFEELFARLEEERATFRAALETSESYRGEITRMADDLSATRHELAAAREELVAQRNLLCQVPVQAASAADPEICERLDRLERERSELAQERALLEAELDTVRTRAAELADTLDDERQRASRERNQWTEELRQMRQMLQSISEREMTPALPAGTPAPAIAEPAQAEAAQDPVLDSVMAQFEILQKDLARRRKAKPAAK